MKEIKLTDALDTIDNDILKNRVREYYQLKKRLENEMNKPDISELPDLIDKIRELEELILKQTGSISLAKHRKDMFSAKGMVADIKKERDKQLSLRKVMDELF
jgi:hypothetical protein